MMASMNFFELLGLSSDQFADAMPERIVEAFHTGGKEAVRELVYEEVSDRLRVPLHVRAADATGQVGVAVYGKDQPGPPIFLVKDSKDLFTRVHEDGTPFAPKEEPYAAPALALGGGGGGGGAPRARKPRPSGGAGGGGGGQSARDRERDATWEIKYQNLLHFVRTHGHRPRRTGEDKERQMCFWLAQQQRKVKDGSLPDDKRDRLMVVLAVKGPAARGGGGGGPGAGGMGGSDQGGSEPGDDDYGGGGGDDDDDGGDDGPGGDGDDDGGGDTGGDDGDGH